MTVVFADGTRVQVPTEHKTGFVANDLEWLQFVHGDISCINPFSSVKAFAVTARDSRAAEPGCTQHL
jgi:hypothetical protein